MAALLRSPCAYGRLLGSRGTVGSRSLGCGRPCGHGGRRPLLVPKNERSALHADDGRARFGPWAMRRRPFIEQCYLVDPASSHMLVSKIKPCMFKYDSTRGNLPGPDIARIDRVRELFLDSMGGGAWPFLVGGAICLFNSVNERDLSLLTSYAEVSLRGQLFRGTTTF